MSTLIELAILIVVVVIALKVYGIAVPKSAQDLQRKAQKAARAFNEE